MGSSNFIKIIGALLLASVLGCANPGAVGNNSSLQGTDGSVAAGPVTDLPSTASAANGQGNGGGILGSATDPSNIFQCELDPNSEKCKKSTAAKVSDELHCIEGLTPVRLVYWHDFDVTSKPHKEINWNPLDHVPSPLAAIKKGCVDQETVLRARYADYCLKLGEDGAGPDQDWAYLGFDPSPAFYFLKPDDLPGHASVQSFSSLEEFNSLTDMINQNGISVHQYISRAEMEGIMRVPGKRSDQEPEFSCPVKPNAAFTGAEAPLGEVLQNQEKQIHVTPDTLVSAPAGFPAVSLPH